MAITADVVRTSGRGRHRLAVVTDRSRSFRRASRHSLAVKSLRVLLPAAALGMAAYYGLAMRLAMGVDGLSLPQVPVIAGENLKMDDPRYEGFGKDGSRFVVTAQHAQQEVMSRTAPIKLTGISGEIVQPDKTVTRLKAARGTFDTKTSTLDLTDGIDIAADNGLMARLASARVLTKDSIVESAEPVRVELPAGSIRGNAMLLKQKQRHVTFTGGVAARLNPQPPRTDAGGKAAPARTPGGMGRSEGPVDVTAEQLVVDDAAKTATFLGSVKARQGESQLESAELEITYSGDAVAAGGAGAGAAAGGAQAASKVRSIVSRTPVVLSQGLDRVTAEQAHFDVEAERARLVGQVAMASGADRRATADAADLDQKADTALLTGAVHVVQGKNELRGRRLFIDRKAGRSQLTSPAAQGQATGRIAARFVPAESERKGGKSKAAAPAGAALAVAEGAGTGLLGGLGMASFKTNPDAPIQIDAERLDVDDTQHTAVFRGDVAANQDDFKVRTPELTAFYSGGAGLAQAGAPDAGRAGAKPQAQLNRIEARKGVTVTAKDGQKATGEWADFDVKANTVVLGGNVVLVQGRSVVRGSKLVIDLTTGESRIVMAPGDRSAPAISEAHPASGPVEPGAVPRGASGRPSATFFPDQMRGGKAAKKPGETAASPSEAPQPRAGDRPEKAFQSGQ